MPQVTGRSVSSALHGSRGIGATDTSMARHGGREEEDMQGKRRRRPWACTWLVLVLMLVLAIPTWAQGVRGGEEAATACNTPPDHANPDDCCLW